MELTLVSLSQDISFEDGSMTNYLVLRTPSGHLLRSIITDDSAKLLFENLAAIQHGVPPTSVTHAPPKSEPHRPLPRQVQDDGSVIFGGDGGTEESSESSSFWPPATNPRPAPPPPVPVEPRIEYADASEQAQAYRAEQKEIKRRIKSNPMGTQNGRTVSKDEYGYPIVRSAGGIDPGEVVGSSGTVDEDGVGSI